MAWRHKYATNLDMVVCSSLIRIDGDGLVSPEPEGDVLDVICFLPEFEQVFIETSPPPKAAPKAKAAPKEKATSKPSESKSKAKKSKPKAKKSAKE